MSKPLRVRTCVGCGERSPQATLVRLAVDAHGNVVPDPNRHASGRGGYLHGDPACWMLFAGRKGTLRSFRRAVSRSEREAVVARLARLRADSEL